MASHGPGAAPGASGGAGLYELLGLGPGASDEAIRSAVTDQRRTWRRRTTSPDIAVRQEAERRMQRLDDAERTLLDPARRHVYDAQFPGGQPVPPASVPPRAGENWLVRAVQQFEAGHYEVAVITAKRVVAADPRNVYAWSVLANAAAAAEDVWTAKEAIEEALSLEPENASLYVVRGKVLAKAGDDARALAAFRTAARLAPGDARLRASLVEALVEHGRLDEAIVEAEQAYHANPDDGDARTALARVLADRAIAAQHELPDGRLVISSLPQASYVESLSNRGLSVQAPDPAVNSDLRRQRERALKARKREFSMSALRRNYRWPVGLGLVAMAGVCCAPNLLDASLGQKDGSASPAQLTLLLFMAGAVLAFAGAVLATCFEPQYRRNVRLLENTVPRRKGRGPGDPEIPR